MKITREGQVFFPYEPCREREDALLALLEGALPREAEKELMEHVEHCPGCSSYLKLQEKVDDAFRVCFSSAPGPAAAPAPVEMPKKLKARLSEVRRDKLARWMFELGRVILFQQQEAVDTIHPGGPLVPVDECFRNLGNLCRTSLEDPYLEAAGLSSGFVKDTFAFVESLRSRPSGLLEVEHTKEALDRTLTMIPDFVPAINFYGYYHYHVKDFERFYGDYRRVLNLTTKKFDKRRCYELLGVASCWMRDLDNSFHYIDLASEIKYDYDIDFCRFVNYYMLRDKPLSLKSLDRMSEKIRSADINGFEIEKRRLIGKYFIRNMNRLRAFYSKDEVALSKIEKVVSIIGS